MVITERRALFNLGPIVALYEVVAWPMVVSAARATEAVLRSTVGPGSRVLDIGTGPGLMAQLLAEGLPAQVVGIDSSPAMIARARRRQTERGDLTFNLTTASSWPEDGGVFDAVVMSYLLRYVELEEAPGIFGAAARAVRPDGTLVVVDLALPKPGPRPILGAWIRGVDGVVEIAQQQGFTLKETRFPFVSSLFVFRKEA